MNLIAWLRDIFAPETMISIGSKIILVVAGIALRQDETDWVSFTTGAAVEGDGANGQHGGRPCYAPEGYNGQTLDFLANAGRPGNWYGVVTNSSGEPLIQQPGDPCPGAYISSTSLTLPDANGNPLPDSSPFKYVDAATVPGIALPPEAIRCVKGVVLGCQARVTNMLNGQVVDAVVFDVGPRKHIGEVSVACAKALGLPDSPKKGGTDRAVILYEFRPGQAAVVNGVKYPLIAA